MANLESNSAAGLELSVITRGVARLDFAQLAAARKAPPSRFAANIAAPSLKHTDEQAVAALVALDRAMTAAGMSNEACHRWGVISTSSYVGRNASAAIRDRFLAEGAWGVSVHATPHRSLHSIASTISLGLQNHGPSFGSGGAPGQEPSGLMAAAGFLQSGQCDGIWLLLTAWLPELAVDVKGQPIGESTCLGVALGLVAQPAVTSVGRVRIRMLDEQSPAAAAAASPQPVVNLTEFLADEGLKSSVWSCLPSPWMKLEIELSSADLRGPHFAMRGASQSRTERKTSQSGQ
jgi:hypothetical protein